MGRIARSIGRRVARRGALAALWACAAGVPATAADSVDLFDPAQPAPGAYHPVPIRPDAIRIFPTGPLWIDPAAPPPVAPTPPVAPPAPAPAPAPAVVAPTSPPPPPAVHERGLLSLIARWLGGDAADEDAAPYGPPPPPEPTAVAAPGAEADFDAPPYGPPPPPEMDVPPGVAPPEPPAPPPAPMAGPAAVAAVASPIPPVTPPPPASAPAPAPAPAGRSLFTNLRAFLGFDDSPVSSLSPAPVVEPAPPPPPAADPPPPAPAAPVPVPPPSAPTPAPAPASPSGEVRVLDGVVLSVGETTRLGAARDIPANPNARPPAGCVLKRLATVAFCVEEAVWPADLALQVKVASIMIQGVKVIVRYDRGVATRIHALIPSEAFEAVAAHYARRLGPPTETWLRSVRQVGGPARDNPVDVWRSRDGTGVVTTLEVRRVDDTRGGFADSRHGAVILRGEDDNEVFPLLSQFDLMLMK